MPSTGRWFTFQPQHRQSSQTDFVFFTRNLKMTAVISLGIKCSHFCPSYVHVPYKSPCHRSEVIPQFLTAEAKVSTLFFSHAVCGGKSITSSVYSNYFVFPVNVSPSLLDRPIKFIITLEMDCGPINCSVPHI